MLSWTSRPRSTSDTFLFLDRDGVINRDRADYVKNWREFRFYADSLEALRWLHERRIEVILISNQSALHRGYTDCQEFWELHQQMIHHIRQAGGDILATFYCPHRPDEHCGCRKPFPEMILTAARLYNISLDRSYMIGDRMTDAQCASQAGCHGILLDRPCHRLVPLCEPCQHSDPSNGAYSSLLHAVCSLYGSCSRRGR